MTEIEILVDSKIYGTIQKGSHSSDYEEYYLLGCNAI
jgi:hypothetical protein